MSGRNNGEIAAALGISLSTVKFHVSSIFNKLGVTNRVEAARLAIERGLRSSDPRRNRMYPVRLPPSH